MAFLDRVRKKIVLGLATAQQLASNSSYADNQGEIVLATDTGNVYIGDSNYRFQIVPTVNLIVTHNDDVVSFKDDVVISY